jgi:nucleoid DNA-binding protein
MNKADLVRALAGNAGVTQDQADKVLKELVQIVVEKVHVGGDTISIPGLGTFKQKKSAARVGRNPSTGGTINIPAKTTLGFKATTALKS